MTDDDGDPALLGDLLDRSFGAGPEGLPTPADRLAAGRRALQRRRRFAVAGSSVAVVVATGLGFAVAGAGGDHGADGPTPPLATQGTTPSPTATSAPTEGPTADGAPPQKSHRQLQKLVSDQFPASFDSDGQIVVKDGWKVTQQVDEPLGLVAPEKSAGVVVERGHDVRWMLITLEHGTDGQDHAAPDIMSLGASADYPDKAYSRFADWLASQVEVQGGPKSEALLAVDGDDTLRPGPGVELVDTRPAPVITRYTVPGDRLAEVRRAGRTWFVVVRGHGAEATVEPVDAEVLPAPTFEALVDYVADAVASGDGLR
jgi:hypothetical protein